MTKETRAAIKSHLEGFIEGVIGAYIRQDINPRELRPPCTSSDGGAAKPFHEAILPHGIISISEFERSFSSRLGSTFEEAARLIAEERFAHAERQYRVSGFVTEEMATEIESIVVGARSGFLRDGFPAMIERVLGAVGGSEAEAEEIADLRVVDHEGNETFFEIKSPKPNKGQCLEATQRLLRIHAIRGHGPPRVRAFYAMAYNPWGHDPSTYNHSFALNYLDMAHQVLLGAEFWDYLGGPGTYQEVLDIYRQVGHERGPDMLDRLALGY